MSPVQPNPFMTNTVEHYYKLICYTPQIKGEANKLVKSLKSSYQNNDEFKKAINTESLTKRCLYLHHHIGIISTLQGANEGLLNKLPNMTIYELSSCRYPRQPIEAYIKTKTNMLLPQNLTSNKNNIEKSKNTLYRGLTKCFSHYCCQGFVAANADKASLILKQHKLNQLKLNPLIKTSVDNYYFNTFFHVESELKNNTINDELKEFCKSNQIKFNEPSSPDNFVSDFSSLHQSIGVYSTLQGAHSGILSHLNSPNQDQENSSQYHMYLGTVIRFTSNNIKLLINGHIDRNDPKINNLQKFLNEKIVESTLFFFKQGFVAATSATNNLTSATNNIINSHNAIDVSPSTDRASLPSSSTILNTDNTRQEATQDPTKRKSPSDGFQSTQGELKRSSTTDFKGKTDEQGLTQDSQNIQPHENLQSADHFPETFDSDEIQEEIDNLLKDIFNTTTNDNQG